MYQLAIIIPFYKGDFIESTFLSLARQTDKRFCLYIGDDASSFDLPVLLATIQFDFPVVYERFDQNLGGKNLVQHWHRSIAITDSEPWIWILCDDDVLGENCVARFLEDLNNSKFAECDVVRFATKVINGGGEVVSQLFTHPAQEKGADFLTRKYRKETRSSLSEFVFSRKSFKHFGGFVNLPLAWGSDHLTWAMFASSGLIYTINDATVHVRASDINISSLNNNLTEKLYAKVRMFSWLKENEKQLGQLPQNFYLMAYLAIENSYLHNHARFSIKDFLILYYLKVVHAHQFNPFRLLYHCMRLLSPRTN